MKGRRERKKEIKGVRGETERVKEGWREGRDRQTDRQRQRQGE